MFTGIIEQLGRVKHLSRQGTLGKLELLCLENKICRGAIHCAHSGGLDKSSPYNFMFPVKPGDSVAVNGVCLTVETIENNQIKFSISQETLGRTTLGNLHAGDVVNLEPALKVGDRLGGHIVQGHVDGVGAIRHQLRKGEAQEWEILAPAELSRYLVTKGSVAVDGISLTIAKYSGCRFWVALIPYTIAHTNLKYRHPGHKVNLEVDVIGKYVEKAVKYNE